MHTSDRHRKGSACLQFKWAQQLSNTGVPVAKQDKGTYSTAQEQLRPAQWSKHRRCT
jgi:hypothetical protein